MAEAEREEFLQFLTKSWIIPHKAVESFGWTFLDSVDTYLHRLPAKGRVYLSPIYNGEMLERKKKFFYSRHLRVSN